ncbi:hypothetical protein PFISCL1PPCAC_17750, partial [Pristionchus fissidentatus]
SFFSSQKMIRFLLLLHFFVISFLAESQCPSEYQRMEDGRCMRPLFVGELGHGGELMAKGIEECAKDGAF